MNSIQEFKYESLPLNVIDKAGEPYFIAKEVCEILEISKYRDAVSRLDDDEKSTCPVRLDGWSQDRDVAVINESGVYSLIFSSNKPNARKFRKWVTSEVLPSIRKTGGYGIAGNDNELINLYKKITDLQSQVMVLQEKIANIQIRQLSGKPYNLLYSERLRNEVIKCFESGYSTRVIAKMFGISINKVLEILEF